MNITDWILIIFSIMVCLIWCIILLRNIHSFSSIILFEKENPTIPENWPKLSIVITACNEAETIEQAITTVLKQNYPNLEIILVNDRSTDQTGKIIDNISKRDSRVKALQITRLPDKWLGKVHALHEASKMVTGEWILYTDADIHFQQGTFRKAIASSISNHIDHLALFPKIRTNSFFLEVLIRTFGIMFLQIIKTLNFSGVGAFNLVRKEALDKTEGLEWLRMEIADDVGLGLLLHRFGAKHRHAFAFNNISLVWYPSISGMVKGLDKNMFSAAQYRFSKLILMTIFLWVIALGPIPLLLYPNLPYIFIFGIITYCLLIASAITGKIRFRENLLPSLFIQFGLIFFSFILLRAGILCKLRGGIVWRGTKYKIEDLISGQRLKL